MYLYHFNKAHIRNSYAAEHNSGKRKKELKKKIEIFIHITPWLSIQNMLKYKLDYWCSELESNQYTGIFTHLLYHWAIRACIVVVWHGDRPNDQRTLCSATLIPPSRRDHRFKKNTIFQASCSVSLLSSISIGETWRCFLRLILPHTLFSEGLLSTVTVLVLLVYKPS